MSQMPVAPEEFWARVVGTYLAQVTAKVGEKVGKTFANLWDRRAKTPPPPASASLFEVPPPLPLALTPLVGREADFAGVLGALMNNRLVTITGVGGVGKTALAQTIARWTWEEDRAKSRTPRGVPYVALDALSSGRDLADFVRRNLLPDSPPPATADENARQSDAVRVIANALNSGARLLVLDNFESAMDDAGAPLALDIVRRLVAATNDAVRVLVTSRRALNLGPIEAEYPLEPLEEKRAIELFYARAGDSVSANDRPTIAEICRLEDCLPLGIELAAAAVQQRTRPLKEMLSALRVTPLDVEIADALGYPARQRGLAATLRYTYDHLPSDAARRLFCAFSVFRSGADRDAVKYVDGTDAWETALRDLVIWKLLDVETTREPWRYTMLATTAAFSAMQMQKVGAGAEGPASFAGLGLDANVLQRRHAEYFVTVAARFDETPMENWREIEVDWQNIKAGADCAVRELEAREGATVDELLARFDSLPTDETDAGLAGEYALTLRSFAYWRRPAEGRAWLSAGLVAFHRVGNRKREALMCNELGLWLDSRGDYAAALGWYEKSVALKEVLGDKAGLAATYNNIGIIHKARGGYAAALEWYGKSVALFETLGDKAGLATTYNNIATIHHSRGDYVAALEWYEKSVALKEILGDKAGLATTYNNIGMIHKTRGDYVAAMEWYEKSVALCEALGDKAGLATTYNNIGEIHRARGDYAVALGWFDKSVALSEVLGDKAGLATTYNNIGGIYFAQKDFSKEANWGRKSAEILQQLGALKEFAGLQWNLATLALAMGDRAQAKQYAQEGLRLYEQLKLEKKAAEVRTWMKENGLEGASTDR